MDDARAISNDVVAEFKRARRRLTVTVTIISASDRSGVRHGTTATAVSSVSLDPSSPLVRINYSTNIHEPLTTSRHFDANVQTTEIVDPVANEVADIGIVTDRTAFTQQIGVDVFSYRHDEVVLAVPLAKRSLVPFDETSGRYHARCGTAAKARTGSTLKCTSHGSMRVCRDVEKRTMPKNSH